MSVWIFKQHAAKCPVSCGRRRMTDRCPITKNTCRQKFLNPLWLLLYSIVSYANATSATMASCGTEFRRRRRHSRAAQYFRISVDINLYWAAGDGLGDPADLWPLDCVWRLAPRFWSLHETICSPATGSRELRTPTAACYYAPAVGGIEGYRDPSVCLSQGAAALGAQLPRL